MKQDWISVDDLMPPDNLDVLVCNAESEYTQWFEDEEVCVAYHQQTCSKGCCSPKWVFKYMWQDKVTHWMPLPKPLGKKVE